MLWPGKSTIEYKEQDEEIALPVKGKKKHLTRNILVDYFGKKDVN